MATRALRDASVLPRPETAEADTRGDVQAGRVRQVVGPLARPVTGLFLAIPLLAVALGVGAPSLLVTVSGASALLLAADLLLERTGHASAPNLGLAVWMIGWIAGLLMLGAAGRTESDGLFHGETVAVVGVAAAAYVASVCPRPTAILWSVAAAAGVGLGVSVTGPATAHVAMAVTSIAVGALAGGLLRMRLDANLEVLTPE